MSLARVVRSAGVNSDIPDLSAASFNSSRTIINMGNNLAPKQSSLDVRDLFSKALSSRKRAVHIDVGAGKGRTLDEVQEIVAAIKGKNLKSIGTEIFLYKQTEYKDHDERIVPAHKLPDLVEPASAQIVTVIAPHPMTPNFADQVLQAKDQVEDKGILFLRHEDFHQKGRNLLLSLGYKVAQLDKSTAATFLRSNYKFGSVLYVVFKDNPAIEKYLQRCGLRVLSLEDGVERLKLLAHSSHLCGAHRRHFSYSFVESFTGLARSETRRLINSWKTQTHDLHLRRYELTRNGITV